MASEEGNSGRSGLAGTTLPRAPESVGLALLVVLDTLAPAERLAFVLHDMFAVPLDEIASILGRSPNATKQLASCARSRHSTTVTTSSVWVAKPLSWFRCTNTIR